MNDIFERVKVFRFPINGCNNIEHADQNDRIDV